LKQAQSIAVRLDDLVYSVYKVQVVDGISKITGITDIKEADYLKNIKKKGRN
jgi:hypothetical protein